MKTNVDDYRRMAVFVAVVEAGGFTAAAGQLGLTKSSVSKLITQLEEGHGVQLLHRTTRSLRPTEAGRGFYERCAVLVQAAESAVALLEGAGDEPRGTLRVAAPIGIGEQLVAPALAEFLKYHPQLAVELNLADRVVDLLAEGVDVAIRGGRLPDSSLIARKIASLRLVVCASPAYLASRKPPRRPADLTDHEWIVYSPLGHPQHLQFSKEQRRESVRLTGRVVANNGAAVQAFLTRGFGLGVLPDFYAAEAIERGDLVTVLDGYQLVMGDVYAVYPPSKFVPPRVLKFVEHLATRLPGATASAASAASIMAQGSGPPEPPT